MNIKRTQFSLVELLVVAAVLLILMSLLSPALKMTLRSANLMACASNLRSLGVVFESFAADNDSEYLSTNKLLLKNGAGAYSHSDPMIRRSYRGWPSSLANYHDNLKEIIYCPEDTTTNALNKSTDNNAYVSYEFKGILVSLGRNHFKRSPKSNEFELPSRQSLLISRGTFHSSKLAGHHSNLNIEYLQNLYFVDGHVALDFSGYNHPTIRGTKVSWLHYPVLENNKKAWGFTDYLQRRCEISEDSF